mgnify:CR=1 FL=1
MRTRSIGALAGLSALTLFAGSAHGVMVSFFQASNNGNLDVSGQMVLEISDLGGGVISFDLSNTGPVESTVKQFNVQDLDGLFADLIAINDSPNAVAFTEDTPAANLAEANGLGFVSHWGATADPPPATRGVDPGESLEYEFSLAAGKTFADVLASLGSGKLRAGLHVISIDGAGSEAYFSNPLIPTPGTLAIAGAAGLIGIRRRR